MLLISLWLLPELVVAGDSKKQETQIMLREINRRFLPSKVLLFTDTSKWDNTLLKLVPFLENQKAIEGKVHFMHAKTRLATNLGQNFRK